MTCLQIFGTNNDAAAAFALLVEVLAEYNAAESRSIPRLRDAWEQKRASEMYGPQDITGQTVHANCAEMRVRL